MGIVDRRVSPKKVSYLEFKEIKECRFIKYYLYNHREFFYLWNKYYTYLTEKDNTI
jgi:hypothetical protein